MLASGGLGVSRSLAMSSVTNRIAIRRSIDDVFAVLTNVEHTGTWFPGDIEEHWTSPPPHGLGSTRHAVVRRWGRETENDAVVTEYDPPHRAAMAGTTRGATFAATLLFHGDTDATTVEVTTDIMLAGAGRVVAPVFAAWYGRQWARGLETLRRLMESGDL